MPSTRASKRKSSPLNSSGSAPKRARKAQVPVPNEVIVIEDSDSDDSDSDLKDILAQIKAQEESECLARSLQDEFNNSSPSGSKDVPIDIEDDAAMARQLAEEWTREDNIQICSKRLSRPYDAKTYKLSSTRPDEGLAPYREIFTKTRNCSKCKKGVESPRGCVMFSDTALPPSLTYLLHAPCSSCGTNHCRGCFASIACPKSCKGPSKNPKCAVLTCCAEVRAIAIFETLGGFDRQFISDRAESDSRALAMAKSKSISASQSVGPGGTGYGTDNAGGYGYNAPARNPKSKQKPLQEFVPKKETHWDNVVLRTLNILVELLPAPYVDAPQVYDMLPHASIGYILSLSQLPTLLATLLRNDSLTDWISRKETYNAMLSLLRRMADCELTIQCLIGQHWKTATTCGLENWMWDDGEIIWSTNGAGDLEILPPLYTYFKKLTKQSEAFLAGAMQMLGAMKLKARHLYSYPPPKKGKGRDVSIHVDKVYEEACESLSFKHVSLAEDATTPATGLHYANYNYAQLLTQTQSSTRQPKSRLHLLKELAVTATSLPPGVWVRVDEVRNDAIKVMIAGPEGTPYMGGLFEFDCFLPIEYPNTPPLMHLRTTGGGTVRFNPNLYNCGKVCLSLLGTWPGRPEEQWSPKSTLLQVLVSIQSMILIDAPYYNEPGHGQANVKAPVSVAYNRNISLQTVKWAIVDWLQDKHRNGIWKDVIASHFTILHDKIRQQ
ncbi:hypothetical protein BDZ97DRAFT_1904683 [Flammula alnicola]|nr:hypothetical protein BDZ97DRAFT_1904683 [Flammula alnicola]